MSSASFVAKGPWGSLLSPILEWDGNQFILIWRLLRYRREKSVLGVLKHWYESWHCHFAAVCSSADLATSLILASVSVNGILIIYLIGN